MKLSWMFGLCMAGLVGCDSGSPGDGRLASSDETPPSRSLEEASSTPVQTRRVNGTVRSLRGTFRTTGDSPIEQAVGFLQEHAESFGITDIEAELGDSRVRVVDGGTSVSFARLSQGVPLDGGGIWVHLQDDEVVFVSSVAPSAGGLQEATPSLSAEEAIDALEEAFDQGDLRRPASRLVAYDAYPHTGDSTDLVLSYRVTGTDNTGRAYIAQINANTGELLFEAERTESAGPYEIARFAPDKADSCDVPCDTTQVFQSVHELVYDGSELQPDVTPESDDTIAQQALEQVVNYWEGEMGRRGFDNEGSPYRVFLGHPAPADGLGGEVHRAIWKSDVNAIFARGSRIYLHVLAHEAVHGVVGTTDSGYLDEPECTEEERRENVDNDWCRRDNYPLWNASGTESGALFEGVPDVFSVFTRQANANDPVEQDWTIKDQLGDFRLLRPTLDASENKSSPEHYDRYRRANFNHDNGTIFGMAMYLLAEDGTHPTSGDVVSGITRQKVQHILYRALQLYFTPRTGFEDARWQMLRACEDFVSRGGEYGIEVEDCGPCSTRLLPSESGSVMMIETPFPTESTIVNGSIRSRRMKTTMG